MRIKTALLNIFMVLLIPISVAAKQPEVGNCSILLESSQQPVSKGMPFDVTVTRDPPFPGQWLAPMVTVEIAVPLTRPVGGITSPQPSSYSQSVTQTVDSLGAGNQALATFVVPDFYNVDTMKDVDILAIVTVPLNKNREMVVATCEGVASFM